jgi:hypothetical protein
LAAFPPGIADLAQDSNFELSLLALKTVDSRKIFGFHAAHIMFSKEKDTQNA